jgi:pimeloyl-ACP methyl ester carboxylesterase
MKPEDIPAALLDHLGVKQATVAGVSSGGTMAIFLAAKRPDLVRRLILSNSPAAPVTTDNMKRSRSMAAAEAALGPKIYDVYKPRSFWDAFFDFYAGEPSRISPKLRDEYYDINRRKPEPNPRAFAAVVADQTRFRAAAEAITLPVLLVWGARDPLLGTASDVLVSYLKNAQISKLMLPDVGHYPPLEVPARYAEIVAADIEAVTPVQPVSPPPAER